MNEIDEHCIKGTYQAIVECLVKINKNTSPVLSEIRQKLSPFVKPEDVVEAKKTINRTSENE